LQQPLIRLVNCYSEPTKGGPSKAIRTRRPGLTHLATLGTGPILRTFQEPGFLNNAYFNVSGGQFYMNTTLLGDVSYSNNPRMCGSNGQLSLVVGGALYIYQNGVFEVQATFDDGYSLLPPLSACVVLYNITLYSVAGSNECFFSSVGNAAVINAANFSSAQTDPSNIVEMAVLAEEVYFFKETAVEIWDFSCQLTAPFSESPGRTYARGCASQGSVVKQDNALFWEGDDHVIYRTGAVPIRVSTSFIEDELWAEAEAGGSTLAFASNIVGHAFYVITLQASGKTYAYDCQTQLWAQWGTGFFEETDVGPFVGQTSSGYGTGQLIGSSVDGRVWITNPDAQEDDTTPIQCVIGGALWFQGGKQRCNNVSLQAVRGQGTPATPNPQVALRYSDDGGQTFSSWWFQPFGGVGQHKTKSTWRALGLMQQPGRLFEIRMADPVNFTVQSASWNEARV